MLFKVKHYIRVQIFFILGGLWVSKDAEFNVDFKNINKMHLKKLFQKNEFQHYTGCPCMCTVYKKVTEVGMISKKTDGLKSRGTVSLKKICSFSFSPQLFLTFPVPIIHSYSIKNIKSEMPLMHRL
jgi:hypothetical protein